MSGEAGSLKRHSRDSLVYLTTCMIGDLVEVHLQNGSVYSGIFHAADVDKDFGIVLKMASLLKSPSAFVIKPPYKTFIIPADQLVQIVAKDLSVLSDDKLKAVQSEKSVELLTDSSISKSWRVDQRRELKPWVPDGEAPEGLANVFDESCKSEEQVLKATPLMVSSQLKIQDGTSPVKESAEALSSNMCSIQESTSLVQTVEEKLPPGKESAEAPPSSMSSSHLTYTSEEWKEERIKSFFKVADRASREAAIACLSHCKWNQDDALSYFFGDYTEAIQDSTSPVKESAEALSSSMSSMQLTNSPEEQPSRSKEEIVKSFRDVVIVASRNAAEACLTHCNWNQEDAISYFSGDYTEANPEIAWSQPDFKATMNVDDGSLKRHSRDSLVYLTTCMIGHLVEAHLKNGSIYSGVFHAADVEKDFGIVLKMASLVKSPSEFVRKPPYKTFIIPADELVQVVAKDLSVFSDGKLKAVQSEKSVELLTDSSISKSWRVDQRRELKPWVPDGEAPEGLDNVFDKPWKSGGWDQFKVNEERFGVKSTFNEEMYTTPLDRGLGTKELEEKAREIAREIEGENTGDLHVAEERGLQVNEKFDTDEEAKYSAVRPVDGFDDNGFDDEDDKLLDTCNDQTFGGSSTSIVQKPASSSGQKPTSSSGKGYGGESCSISDDPAGHLPSEQRSKDFPAQGSSTSESQLGERRNNKNPDVAHSNGSREESVSGHRDIKEGANLGGGGTSGSKNVVEKERQVSQVSGKTKSESSLESGPAPSTSTRPGLSSSPSSSSLPSSEKSILNPNAKEFKPSQLPVPVRPQSQPPVAGGSFYYAAPPPPVQQMPVVPAGYGIQPRYPGQQQQPRYLGHEYPQTYYPRNAPPQYQLWQQMMMQGPQFRPPDMDYLPLPPPPYQPGNPHYRG